MRLYEHIVELRSCMQRTSGYVGTRLGDYRLTLEFTSSPSNRVFLGESTFYPKQFVVIKLLDSIGLDARQEREQIFHKVYQLKHLHHSHIASIIDFGITGTTPYIMSEYVSDGNLYTRLQRRFPQPLPVDDALSILLQIGQALEYVHQQDIIHGNLKAQNVLFNDKGEALLVDFCVSPSSASKEDDVYALGELAYEILTGQQPFTASVAVRATEREWTEALISPQALNTDIPASIELALLTVLSPDVTQRYTDVQSFLNAIDTSKRVDEEGQRDTEDEATTIATELTQPIPPVATALSSTLMPVDVQEVQSPVAELSIPAPHKVESREKVAQLPTTTIQTRSNTKQRQKGKIVVLLVALMILVAGISAGYMFTFSSTSIQQKGTTTPPTAHVTSTSVSSTTRTVAPSPTPKPSSTIAKVTATPVTVLKPVPTATPLPVATPTVQVVPSPTLFPSPVATLTQNAIACRVIYVVNSDWGTGFTTNIAITNTGTQPIKGWTLAWTFSGNQTIIQAWNANSMQQGQNVTLSSSRWNNTIPPGRTTSGIGFYASYSGVNSPPSSLSINGTPCS